MSWWLLVPVFYGAGLGATWFFAARHWVGKYGGGDALTAGGWGFMVAVIWPVFALGWLVGKAAQD